MLSTLQTDCSKTVYLVAVSYKIIHGTIFSCKRSNMLVIYSGTRAFHRSGDQFGSVLHTVRSFEIRLRHHRTLTRETSLNASPLCVRHHPEPCVPLTERTDNRRRTVFLKIC